MMPSMATLSRWTMSYFAAGIVLFIAAQALMLSGFGYPFEGLRAPSTLILVHLVVIGWLSLVMAGALQQFVPVLVARPLAFARLALPALILLFSGLAALLAGFAGLGGIIDAPPELLAGAALLLTGGSAMLVLMLAMTIFSERPITLFAGFVLAGLTSLMLTVFSGSAFAMILSGWVDGSGAGGLLAGVGLHALLGLGGWLGLTAFGVGYRLYAMFMLAPETPSPRLRRVLLCAISALLPAVAGLVLLATGHDDVMLAATLSVCGLAFATALHVGDVISLFRERRRQELEFNMRASLAAYAALALGMALLPPALIFDAGEPMVAGVGFLLVFGCLSGLTLSQLVKIVAFMTWIEVFASRIGRAPIPRVGELVDGSRVWWWLVLYFCGVAAGTIALVCDVPEAFRAAMALCLTGTLGVASELVRIRRLSRIEQDRCPPVNIRPGLFLTRRSERRKQHVAVSTTPHPEH